MPGIKSFRSNFLKLILLFSLLFWSAWALADPPFLTNSAQPSEYKKLDVYLFSWAERAGSETSLWAPALELDYGIVPRWELHLITYMASFMMPGSTQVGFGDTEVGVEYQFLQESKYFPALAFFPMAELPAGDANRYLGNGVTWYRLPLGIQKSWGDWLSYAQIEYDINPAVGMQDSWSVGLVIQRQLTKKLALGAELYAQSATSQEGGIFGGSQTSSYTIINIGAIYNFTPTFALQASIGRSIAGAQDAQGYFGFYWNVG